MRVNLLAALIGMLCVAGCGGGGSIAGGGNPGGGGTPTGSNVQAVTVDSGPPLIANSNQPALNTLYTTVTVCSPGSTTNCQTIDHIQVDTGSSGLRIIASVLTITLPFQYDASHNVIAECTQFVDGSSWGPIRQADVKIGGETASNQEVQVIGDAAYPAPTGCSGTNPNSTPEDTVTAFGANGILGIGPFIQDCGPHCQQITDPAVYFTCPPSSVCSPSAMPVLQVANPVASFATDNNGVIIQLPSVGATGSAAVSGYLIFGIGTQGNNGLGSATVLMVDPDTSFFTTNYNQLSLTRSFIDSGSNAYYFPDTTINTCPDGTVAARFFCPPSTLNLTGTMVSPINGASKGVNFSVANANNLFPKGSVIAAASNIAAPTTSVDNSTLNDAFDWGLPFFFGQKVYTAIETRNTSGGVGPYFAF